MKALWKPVAAISGAGQLADAGKPFHLGRMRFFSLFGGRAQEKAEMDLGAVLRVGGGTSALLRAHVPGTRDYALVCAEKAGLLVRSPGVGRIDLLRTGPVFHFTLTAEGELARRRLEGDSERTG